MAHYRNPAIRQLKEQQVRYAPREVRLEQINRTESLLQALDPTRDYDYPEICERITSYRPSSYPDLQVSGSDALHDLRLFVEELSDSADISVDQAGEEVLTVEEVSRRYNVSTKTVDRWRDKGLVSRRFLFGGRKRVGFLRSSVEWFVTRNTDQVGRGSSFSQVSAAEREQMIRWARRLARYGGCPTEIARRLAKRFNRSQETIRYTLKHFDRLQPAAAVFVGTNDPLDDLQRKALYQAYRDGTSIDVLAEKYARSKSSVYRLIAETRCHLLLEQEIDFIDSPEFHKPDAAASILVPPPVEAPAVAAARTPPGLPVYLASLYTVPLLTREEEGYYFRKMNFLKFQAVELRKQMSAARPLAGQMQRVEDLLEESGEVKNFLIKSNLRLVVSIAKKHLRPGSNFFEMVSDGNLSLMKAIDKFDYGRGFKFSTYASWAIMKNFARSIPAENTQLDRFRTGADEMLLQSREARTDQFQQELVNAGQHEALMGILERLDEREREIIVQRYGLGGNAQALTLEQVGQRLGVTKERIRQIESRALKKLRQVAEDDHVEIPEL